MAKLLSEIGALFAADGIFWISGIIEQGSGLADAELETNTVYYLENLLRTDLSLCAASKPALTAVHLDRPTEHWSRGELRERVNALAAGLTGLGLTPGSRVAIIAPNSPGAILGCLAASAARSQPDHPRWEVLR